METFRCVGDLDSVQELKTKYEETRNKPTLWSKLSILNSMNSVSPSDVASLLTDFLKGIKGGLVSPETAKDFCRIISAEHPSSVFFFSSLLIN